jgi:predicted lipid-binding transport protein (Tim44 family)
LHPVPAIISFIIAYRKKEKVFEKDETSGQDGRNMKIGFRNEVQQEGMENMKKIMLMLLACMLVFSFSAVNEADAKRGGAYRSGTKSFAPTKPQDNATKANTSNTSANTNAAKSTAATTATAQKGGLFSGGGFMKGLMIGGLAGLLFGSLFGDMGFLGQLLGLMINLMAIFLVVILAMRVYFYFKDRRKPRKGYQE